MTERQANERRNWKAMLFPYDEFIPDESEECQYCLTDKQATYLRGLLEPAGWVTRWWSDENEIDQDKIESFRDDLIRRLMMTCCGGEFEIIFQWTEGGTLQQSSDGGATWQDAPQEDPRNSSTVYPPVPEVEGQNLKCNAAKGIRNLIKEQVGDQLTDDMSRYTLGQLINDWVTTYIQTSNPFEALITIITNQILALVIATLRPALTDDVYDELECCMYNNMATDLSFSDEQWDSARNCISTNIVGIAGVFLEHLIFLIGRVGLTNMARAQSEIDATCSCAGCDLTDWTFFDSESGITNTKTDFYWEIQAVNRTGGGGVYYVIITSPSALSCCAFTAIDVVSGSVDLRNAWTECGEEPSSVVDGLHRDYPIGTGTNAQLWQSNTPFTVGFSTAT
jgi:hypothetical protein